MRYDIVILEHLQIFHYKIQCYDFNRRSRKRWRQGTLYQDAPGYFIDIIFIKNCQRFVIEDCAKDGGEEFFTEMHCVL